MTTTRVDDLQIRVVPADQRVEALLLVFDWDAEPQRLNRVATCLRAAREYEAPFDHLLEARRGGARRGATWAQVVPGRLAHVWPPGLVAGEADATADALLSELDLRLTQAGVQCGQAMLPGTARAPAECLMRRQYLLAAQLLFLANTWSPHERPESELDFEPYRDDQQVRLAALVDATYTGTQDAPLLNDWRSSMDVVDGYRQTGEFSAERWRIVRHEGRDVGCLLVTLHRGARRCELLYMGLVPAARGRGWGRQLVRYAQWLAGRAGAEALLVGVDAANQPALSAYVRCGFEEVDRRLVFIKRFSPRS